MLEHIGNILPKVMDNLGSGCIWKKVWDQYQRGEITAEQLDEITKDNQQVIKFK